MKNASMSHTSHLLFCLSLAISTPVALFLLSFVVYGQSLQSAGGPAGGKITSLLKTRNGIEYVGTAASGYVWRRNYSTMEWEKVHFGNEYGTIAGIAQDIYSTTILAAGKDVWRTIDDGVSWTKSSLDASSRPGKFWVALDGTIFTEGFYRSNNGGRSFISIGGMYDPESFLPLTTLIRYIGENGRLKHTTNGYSYSNVGTNNYGRPYMVHLGDSVIYAVGDGSASWTMVADLVKNGKILKGLPRPPLRGKPVLAADGNRIVLTSNVTDSIYVSYNAGEDWVGHAPIPVTDTISCVSICGDSVYVGTYYNGLLHKTLDAVHWNLYSSTISKSYVNELRVTDSVIIAAVENSRIVRYQDAYMKFDSLNWLDNIVINIALDTAGCIIAICRDSSLFTYDGQGWRLTYKGPAMLYDITSDGVALYGAGRASLYKSTDNGSNWNVLPGAYRYRRIYYARGRLYGYSRLIEDYTDPPYYKALCSTNGGVYWDEITSGTEPISEITDININDYNNKGLLVNYGANIYHTTDGGVSWSKTQTDWGGPFSQTLKYAAVSDDGTQIIASKKKGVYLSRDGFRTYQRIDGGPDQDQYTSLKILGTRAYIGTQEDGMYVFDIKSSTWYHEAHRSVLLNVYPTVSLDGIYTVAGVNRLSTLLVYDHVGRVIFTGRIGPTSSVLDLSGAPVGTYLVFISDGLSRCHAVIVKQ